MGGIVAAIWAWLRGNRNREAARAAAMVPQPVSGPSAGGTANVLPGQSGTATQIDITEGQMPGDPWYDPFGERTENPWANSFFGSSPVASPVPLPDVLTLADVRAFAGDVIDRHFRGRVDPAMVAAMAEIESGFRRKAYRFEAHIPPDGDASYGLMQNLYRTNARWLYDTFSRYRAFRLDQPEDLYDPSTAIYFGCAYIDWLKSHPYSDGTEDWIVMAYNGGPGNVGKFTTPNHLAKYKAAKARQAKVK